MLPSFSFSMDDVNAYVTAIRGAGAKVLETHFQAAGTAISPAEIEALSLPFLSWCYYGRKSLPAVSWLAHKMQQDVERSRFRCGDCVITADRVEPMPEKEALFEASQTLMQRVWPAMAELSSVLCRRVSCIPQGQTYESSSDPKALGQIYFNMQRKTPMGWAEVLAHETGHQYLFIMSAKPEVFAGVDWNQITFSSIKGEQRPLIALFHGATAECAMLNLALRARQEDASLEEEAKALMGRYREGFLRDYEALKTFGVMGRNASIDSFYETCAHALPQA